MSRYPCELTGGVPMVKDGRLRVIVTATRAQRRDQILK